MGHFYYVNYFSVLLATIASFMLGGFWYSKAGFGQAWLAAIGKSMDDLGSPAVAMSLTFVSTFITAVVLAILINALGDPTLFRGARLGFVLGIGVVATSMFSDHLFCGNPLTLYLIQAGYRVTLLTIMGGILGVWS